MCDNCAYVLGLGRKPKSENMSRVEDCFRDFVQLHETVLKNTGDEGSAALLLFLRNWNTVSAETHPVVSSYLEDITEGGNLVFKLDGFPGYLHERDAVVEAWSQYKESRSSDEGGQCLVTGKSAGIARLHPSIKGVTGAQSTGASLVSFNPVSYTHLDVYKRQFQNTATIRHRSI